MIRRISKNNDLKDIIKSCPSGVIDDIYKIEYFIQGYNTYIEATFSKVNNVLEVILPSEDLQTLPNGILMRKAYYKVIDSSYPDGYYNLEFEDNMNIWLGESEGIVPPSPTPGEYVTEEEFVSTLSSYATQNWVSSNQFATQSWVSNKGYLTSVPSSYATKSWVSSNFLSTSALTGYATESWVEAQGYITSTGVSGLATQSWVLDQGYITSTGVSGLATMSWVESQGYLTEVPDGYATQSWVLSQNYYAPGSSEIVLYYIQPTDLNPIVSTPLIIGNYAEGDFVEGVEVGAGGLTVMRHYYQESQMSQDYTYQVLTESNFSWYLDGYATESWVSSNFLSTTALTGYATESWVSSQQFITSVALSGYATQSWATSQFLEESKIWTGTQSQWDALTPAQQALYTIALVTE